MKSNIPSIKGKAFLAISKTFAPLAPGEVAINNIGFS
jgi:hypothetical protein